MTKKINTEIKEIAIEALKTHGTMNYAAKISGVSVRTLNEEMRRSDLFKRRVLEARAEGKANIADNAIEMIKLYASGEVVKTDRNVLTANIALANAYEPGFRGTTNVQGRIEHDVRVITAVPRPNYGEIEASPALVKMLPKGKKNHKRGRPFKNQGVIEGVIVETEE
jgi:poly-gamma-glutamate capsule biosynthesis protein CapA/YwtB (metallophosphatase superfamily)